MKVKELLDDKNKWTQGCYARDIHGNELMSDSPYAVCWCLSGAIKKCYTTPISNGIIDKIMGAIYNKYPHHRHSIPSFNDQHTYEEVMEIVNELDI